MSVALAASDRGIRGCRTDEASWLAHERLQALPEFDLQSWVERHHRIWIIAPHPDDEILGVGAAAIGLLHAGADVRFVSVTDGEASHPDSPTWTCATLGRARRDELDRALKILGARREATRLALPDGAVSAHRDRLHAALIERVSAGDLMLVTWRLDGHPDHEACGQVARQVAESIGATVVEYPVWMWHWANVDERSIPWHRARRISASRSALERKAEAIAQFVSQTAVDDRGHVILPPHVLERFARRFEVVFV